MKIDCLDEKTISDIGRAFAYYDYGAERGLVSAFAQKEQTEIYICGFARQLNWPRSRKLLTIGLAASVLHCIGDLVLGWGVEDETLTGMMRLLAAV